VREETSVVRWDGRTERIVMRLTLGGDASEAAWIMPVPGRATVEPGDRALFEELEEVTAPVRETRRHFWPRSGDWPFDGADGAVAGALDGRLRDNGFELPDRLARELEPYVEEERQYVAVRLAPAREDGDEGDGKNGDTPPPVLGGALDPLSITFGSDRRSTPCACPAPRARPRPCGCTSWPPTAWSPPVPPAGSAPRSSTPAG
jgi:hypothetical protein